MEGSKGGIALRSSFRFDYRLLRASCIAGLGVLLTGCLSATNNFGRAAANENLIAPIQSTGARDSTPASDQFNLFWDAIADLDMARTKAAARTQSQMDLADGVAALAAGNDPVAEEVFQRLISDDTDPNVSSAARLLFAAILMYEHQWSALSSFAAATHLRSPTQSGTSGIQKWGDAFAGIDPQTIEFPEQQMTLPLAITPVGTPTVQVRINGKDYQFWLDTGSSMTVLSSDVALEAGIQPVRDDTLTIATFAGVAPARPALVSRMEIGSVVVTNSPAIVIESRLMRVQSNADGVPWSGLPVDGIIGWDLIRRFDISLDYASGKSIWQHPRDLETLGTDSQNLTWVGKPLIRLLTKSGVTLHLTLDTGSQSSFLSARVLGKAQATASTTNARAYGIAGTGGQQLARAITPLHVELAGKSLMLRDLIVYSPGSQGLINCDGILGSDVAHFGTIRIDATNGLFSVG
jgi:clan AA aspartic protease (TIGR02281 family)